MFPPPPNPVVSTEHGRRDSRLPAVPHTEDAEEKGRRVVLGMSELSNQRVQLPPRPSGTTESQDAAAEAADPSSPEQSNRSRVGQAMEEMAQIRKLLEGNSEPASQ